MNATIGRKENKLAKPDAGMEEIKSGMSPRSQSPHTDRRRREESSAKRRSRSLGKHEPQVEQLRMSHLQVQENTLQKLATVTEEGDHVSRSNNTIVTSTTNRQAAAKPERPQISKLKLD